MTHIKLTILNKGVESFRIPIWTKYAFHNLITIAARAIKDNKKVKINNMVIDVEILPPNLIHEINLEYMNKNYPTNVISVPIFCHTNSHNQMIILGTVSLCPEIIKKEAEDCFEERWLHLFVHGLLHIIGFDHETQEDLKAMENLEFQILNSFLGKKR